MPFYTYIVASKRNGTLYTGSTDDLAKWVFEHQSGTGSRFTAEHSVGLLVWYEVHETREAAFTRERQIKEWKRLWQLELIARFNPGWRDRVGELI